jgi:hypothetical protein
LPEPGCFDLTDEGGDFSEDAVEALGAGFADVGGVGEFTGADLTLRLTHH